MATLKKSHANDNTDGMGITKRLCALCGKPQQDRFKPFCSKRCADVDLNRWLTGAYAIPVSEKEESSEGEGE